MLSHRPFLHAFSLVELSIVLVILGLLIGGILAGQSLIRAGELRAVSTEHGRYMTAFHAFRDKYMALPGDMTNAQSFWGIAHATPATCASTIGTGTQTCNGDGDGQLDFSAGSAEYYRVWQHLANAGLIEGSYTGWPSGGSYVATAVPQSKLTPGVWYIGWMGTYAGDTSFYAGNYGNYLQFFHPNGATAIIKPEEAWNLDAKMDDGIPRTGKLVAYKGSAASPCTTVANTAVGADLNGTYNLSSSGMYCWIMWPQAI